MYFLNNDETNYNGNTGETSNEEELSEFIRYIKNTDDDDSWFNLSAVERFSEYCIENEKLEEGLVICRYWLEHMPDSVEALNKQSFILLNLDRLSEALRTIERAIEISPSEQENTLMHAMILDNFGKHEEALKIIEGVVETNDDENALYAYGNILQSNGKYQKALDIFLYLEENRDFNEEFLYQEIAFCYNMLEDFEKSIEYYEKAAEETPYDYNVWYNKGIIHSTVKQYDKAIESYELALAIDSKFFLAWFNLAYSYSEKEELDKAVEAYKEALNLKPKDLDSLHNLASVLGDNNQVEEAKDYFEKAVSLYPDYSPSIYGLAVCHETLGDFTKAEEYFDLAISKSDGTVVDALHSKALMYARAGKPQRATETFEEAISKSPDKRNLLLDFVRVMFEFNRFDVLEKHLLAVKQYFEKQHEDLYPEIYFYLSAVFAQKDDFKSAEKYLVEGLQAGKKSIHKMNDSLKKMIREFSGINPDSYRNN